MSPLPDVASLAPTVKVNGQELAQTTLDQIRAVTVSRRLRLAGRATLSFHDTGFVVSSSGQFSPNAEVKIGVASGTSLFSGIITGVEVSLERGMPMLTVIIDDLAVKLGNSLKPRTYQQMTASQIVQEIAGRHGLSAQAAMTSVRYPYLLQTSSDLAFLDELAERVGFDWYVLDKALHFTAPSAGAAVADLEFGGSLTEFRVRASALHPGAVVSRGWSPTQKQEVNGRTEATSALRPSSALATGYLAPTALGPAQPVEGTRAAPHTAAEGSELSKAEVQRWTSGAVVANGSCDVTPALVPGSTVKISQAGPVSGEYRVTEVVHRYDLRGFRTDFVAGDRAPSSLVDSLSSQQASSFRHDGLVVGIVTAVGNPDDAIACVKVKYPALSAEVDSNWARVAALGAGAKRGMTFLPEVNDEVLVGFEGGDPRRPVILGGLFNGKDGPEIYGSKNSKVTQRRITSRLGHYIELSDGDAPAEQSLSMVLAGAKHSISLSKEKLAAEVPSGTPISLKAGSAEISIGADGSITIKGSKVSITADTDVTIQGANIKAKATAAFEASALQATIKASGKAEMSATGVAQISGALVKIN